MNKIQKNKKIILLSVLITFIAVFAANNIMISKNIQNHVADDKLVDNNILCPKAEPENLLNATNLKDYSFILNNEKNELVENAILNNGTFISVINFGCEYYNLEFKLQFTNNFSNKNLEDAKFWYLQTSENFTEIKKNVKFFSQDINNISNILKQLMEEEINLTFDQEIYFTCKNNSCSLQKDMGTGINYSIILSKPQLIDNLVEISVIYSIGPL